jgi:hypothetical protein
MADIETRLRAAMHAAVDAEEAAVGELMMQVRRRHRRHNVVVAGIATLLLLAAGVPAVVASHVLATGSGPAPATHLRVPLPTKMSGSPMPAGTNFSVLISTPSGAAWYSTATGRTQHIAGLPVSQNGYQFGGLVGGYWARSNDELGNDHRSFAGVPEEYYFIADGSRTATPLAKANPIWGPVRAHRSGAVWMTNYRRSSDDPVIAAPTVRLFSMTGQPLSAPIRLPAGDFIHQDMGGYLLLGSYQIDRSVLWDPQTGQVVRTIHANVIDSAPGQIATWEACATCRLQVLNLSTGKSFSIPVLAATPAPEEAFSQDGSLLAVQLPDRAIYVLNTTTGALTVISGTALSSTDWQNFGWQAGSHRLVITAGPSFGTGPVQFASWQPGHARLEVATLHGSTAPNLETGLVG